MPNKQTALILVVDDDDATRMMLYQALEAAHYAVQTAEDGVDALDKLEEFSPNLILLDVMMPELNGFATCAEIRKMEAFSHIPVLMMTGLDDMESINLAFDVGATDFITKPFNLALLTQRVRYALRTQQRDQAFRRNQARLAQVQRIAQMAYWEYDPSDKMLRWSKEIEDCLGFSLTKHKSYPSQENWGDLHMPLATFLSFLPEDSRARTTLNLTRALEQHLDFCLEEVLHLPNGDTRTVLMRGEAQQGEEGQPYMLGAIQDLSSLARDND